MIGYIRDINSFNVLYYGNVTEFDAPIASGAEKTGTVVVADEIEDFSGHWLWLDKYLWLIKKSQPDNGVTTLTVVSWANAFERTLLYSSSGPYEYGSFITGKIQTEFAQQPDAQFAMPYITVTNTDETGFSLPELKENVFYGEYSLSDVMKAAMRSGVLIDPEMTTDGLSIAISTKEETTRRIVFGDGKSQLTRQEFSRDIISKLTVYRENEAKTDWEEFSNYYYNQNGRITASAPEENMHGVWGIKVVSYDYGYRLIDAAWAEMKKNVSSHKIEFCSFIPLKLWDTVLLALPSGIFYSKISGVSISSKDNRFYYECGMLATKLTDRLTAESDDILPETYPY